MSGPEAPGEGRSARGPKPVAPVAMEDRERAGYRQCSPSAERNTGPIVEVLVELLPESGRALEIASGTGQHVVAFARAFPGWHWTPSDPHRAARESIAAWIGHGGADNVAAPLDLDVCAPEWEQGLQHDLDLVLAINLLHISPWGATLGLLRGAGTLLRDVPLPAGQLVIYGAFKRDGRHTAPSNEAFDRSLRAQDPAWGVRDVAEVTQAAAAAGLALEAVHPMPANNLVLRLRPG